MSLAQRLIDLATLIGEDIGVLGSRVGQLEWGYADPCVRVEKLPVDINNYPRPNFGALRILLVGQTNPAENGVYVTNPNGSATLYRLPDEKYTAGRLFPVVKLVQTVWDPDYSEPEIWMCLEWNVGDPVEGYTFQKVGDAAGLVKGAAASMYLSANANSGGNGWRKVPFNTIEYDADGLCDLVNRRFVAKTSGYYRVSAGVFSNVHSSGNVNVALRRNGTGPYEYLGIDRPVGQASADYPLLGGSKEIFLAAGEYVEVYQYWSPADWSFYGSTTERLTWATISMIAASVGVVPEPWKPITFLNGWATFSGYPASYRKYPDGKVRLRGYLNAAGGSAGHPFTLPPGYRPSAESPNGYSHEITYWHPSSYWINGRLTITPDGQCKLYNNADALANINYVKLYPIEFPTD